MSHQIAFGPEMPGFGSWEWVGADLCDALSADLQTTVFQEELPDCDAAVFIKFHPTADSLPRNKRMSIIYCPIDYCGSATEIDQDAEFLIRCDAIIVHCHRLEKYFSAYAPTFYLDHHLKYTISQKSEWVTSGPILWTGVRTNLGPVVNWANRTDLPEELWILTNFEQPDREMSPADFGFNARNKIRVECWTPEKHLEWLKAARAAVDIKGDDFRSRHKPPTKACDVIASGVPLAMNPGSSSVEYFRRLDFAICNVADMDRCLSREYWESTQMMAHRLQRTHSIDSVMTRFLEVLDATITH